MSNLVPSLIELNKGLDMQTPKITAEAGTVLDSLNYEQVDFQGQKRIDGFTRYDGNTLPIFDEYYALYIDPLPVVNELDLVFVDDEVFAVVVSPNSFDAIIVAVINDKLLTKASSSVRFLNRTSGVKSEEYVPIEVVKGTEWDDDPDDHYNNLLAYHKVLRKETESLPGPIAGLHWFRDRLYAVADVVAVSLDGTTPQIFPNDIINNGLEDAKVLDSFVLADTRVVFIDSFDSDGAWQEEGRSVSRGAESVGVIAEGFNFFGPEGEIASFFESRTEQQAIDEDGLMADYGWRFKDLGWKIGYEDGSSLYGSLPSLNQNIEGLGVQGPTSISGNNGKPTALTQNVSIADKREQVNGWKSSQTPSSYDLDVDNITDIDDEFIYADAFISWTADSTVVSSPGLTTNTLEARDAEASVIIETA